MVFYTLRSLEDIQGVSFLSFFKGRRGEPIGNG